jgi:esterase/lipase superfamily enzyme
MKIKDRKRLWIILFSLLLASAGSFGTPDASPPCCSEDSEGSYLLSPRSSQRFQYLVRYESLFSKELGKEKGFFILLPEDFYQRPRFKYPVLFLLHGYNFHRRGVWWKVGSPEKAIEILCKVKEEEYHWLLHEDIALIAYAMMASRNRTYQDLERDLEERFGELARHGGLGKGDSSPKEIAQSIVFQNLHPGGNSSDPFHPLMKMIIVLPDGDNGFYTDENEGKKLFPETKESKPCDRFQPGEAFHYSLLPFLLMKPGALGRHESYFLEMLRYLEGPSPYRDRVLNIRGLGGISMGGFGAVKLGLKHPRLFQSVSSQSGLLDIDLLRDKWMLKMIMPEFLEVFGRLEAQKLPPSSFLDGNTILANNPLTLMKEKKILRLPSWLYFDYGKNERFHWITGGNQNVEKTLNEKMGSHQIPVQPHNGMAAHNNLFWRSRSGNILKHHSDVFRKAIAQGRSASHE